MATPKEAPEGIKVKGVNYNITGIVSVAEIEVVDLISQGPIDGLVDREYTFQGTEGNVGWDS
jgi:predicted phage tail protein